MRGEKTTPITCYCVSITLIFTLMYMYIYIYIQQSLTRVFAEKTTCHVKNFLLTLSIFR